MEDRGMTREPARPDDARPGQRSTAFALAGLSLAVLVSTLNTSIVNVALPTLTQAFHASTQAVQWTVIAFVLAITSLIVSAGRIADIFGRRRILLVGIALFTTAAATCAAAPDLGWLIAFRFLQGIGAAMMMALSVALIGDLTSTDKTGRAMGLLGAMSATGTALGPALGGLLISEFGWPALFLVNVPPGLAAFALLWRHLPPDHSVPIAARRDFDTLGTLLLAAGLAAYALALTRSPDGFGIQNVAMLTFAVVALIGFVRVQKTESAPLLRIDLLRSRSLRSGLGMSLLVGAVMMSTLVVGPFYLSQALAVDTRTIGFALSVGPVVAAVVAGPAGRWVDRIGAQRTTLFGLVGAGTGCLALALVPAGCGVAGYLIPIAIMTAGYSLFQTANNTAVMHGAAANQRGVISGVLNLSRNLGLLTGATFLGGVFALVANRSALPHPDAVVFATRITFSVATAFIVGAYILGVRGGRLLRAPASHRL